MKSEDNREMTISDSGKSFTLRAGQERGKIWIECEDGEGGDFDQGLLFLALKRFYDENF